MKLRTLTSRQALAALGACLGLVVLASPAHANPDGYQPQLANAGPDLVDRYLAIHRAQEEPQSATEPTVIPYLSHGIGVDDRTAPALREQPDGFQPQLRGADSVGVASPGFDWETTGFVAGGILAATLLALMSTIALRQRGGLRSA